MKKTGSIYASREFRDIDYWNKLSDEEKKWLNKFVDEHDKNYFTSAPVHDTPELKRKCYQNDDARRRDIWNNFRRLPYHLDINSDLLEYDDEDDK